MTSYNPVWNTMRKLLNLLPALALLNWLAITAARAADVATEPETGFLQGFGLGIAGISFERPYTGIGSKHLILPAISYENNWLRVGGLGIDWKIGNAGPVSFAFGARYFLIGYRPGDAPILNGLEERKAGIWLGPSLLWHTDFATFSAQVLGDPLDYSDGTQVRISGEHPFNMGNFQLVPRVSAIWYDRNYVDYNYGVRTNEATPGRPAYQGSSDADFEIGMRANYSLSQHQLMFLDLDDTQQGSAVRESPLVDRTNETGVRLGYLYRF
jgi:MipA family protein